MKRQALTHARIDAPHLADGLFVLTRGREDAARKLRAAIHLGKIPKSERPHVTTSQNRIITTTWGDISISFACVEVLGVTEQSVLLALVARAGIEPIGISPNGKSARSRELHALLKADDVAANRGGIMVETSIYELVADLEKAKCGTAYDSVEAALWRLSNVVVTIADSNTKTSGNSLLLNYRKVGDRVEIAMNYRIREALLSTGFTRVSLSERAALKGDIAKLMHTFLSRWVGKIKRTILLETLAKHIWDDGLGNTKDGRSKRRSALREALEEIRALGWQITEEDDTVIIQRHAKSVLTRPPIGEKTGNLKVRKPATFGEKTGNPGRRARGAETPIKWRISA